MPNGESVTVRVDLPRVFENLQAVKARVGVPVYAVVKADAYGLGAAKVAATLAEIADGFVVFSLAEAMQAALRTTHKPVLAIGPGRECDLEMYVEHKVHPAVWGPEQAAVYKRARPVLSVDTGMRRFACPPEQIEQTLAAGGCKEAFTHATKLDHAKRLAELAGGRGLRLHAAASALLDEPDARLDAVRPGLALYRGAARVGTKLVEAKDARGPAGYGGFTPRTGRVGVILCGYAAGLRPGPCLVNGRRSRLLEVGMQSSFVEIARGDRAGDEVVLLGDSLTEDDVAAAWGTTPHEALVRLTGLGRRVYDGAQRTCSSA